MLDALLAAALQDVQESDDVALHVGMGILDGIAHARLRGQMHHALELLARESACMAARSAISALAKRKFPIALAECSRRAGFKCGVVIGVQVVESDDLIAARRATISRYGIR